MSESLVTSPDAVLTQGELVALLAKRLRYSERTIFRKLPLWDVPRIGLEDTARYRTADVLAWLEARWHVPVPQPRPAPREVLEVRKPRRPLRATRGSAAVDRAWPTGPALDTGSRKATLVPETCARERRA